MRTISDTAQVRATTGAIRRLAAAMAISSLVVLVPTTETFAAGSEGMLSYATTTQSRSIEFYARIPYTVTQGVPSATVNLEDQGVAQCDVIAGMFDGGLIEEYVALSADGKYQNPTQMHAGNQRGALPPKAEFGAAPGPHATAACPTPLSGSGTATSGGHTSDQLGVESATANGTANMTDQAGVVVNEAVSTLHGVKVGDVALRQLESWIKVDWRVDQEPLVSYRIVLQGLSKGTDDLMLNGEKGLALGGENVLGSEFVKQFNEQAKAHESDLSQLGTYGFRLLQPRVIKEPSGRQLIENAVVEAGFGLAARKDQIGNFQGMRLGVTRVSGRITSVVH